MTKLTIDQHDRRRAGGI